MRRLMLAGVVLAAASGASLRGGAALQTGSPSTLERNKQLIVDFFAFTGGRQERADRFMTEDYVQHNPRFLRMDELTGARGRQAWVRAGEEAGLRGGIPLVALGGIPLRNPIILTAEGELAHAVYRGTLRDPDEPDTTYEAFAFETFRIRDGKFSEHWDQVRLAPGWMTPPRPATPQTPLAGRARGAAPPSAAAAAAAPAPPEPRAGCSATPAQLDADRRLVLSFFEGAPTVENLRQRASLLAESYVQHNPRFVEFNEKNGLSGRQGFIRAIESGILAPPAGTAPPPPRVLDVTIAECDYVSVVWKQVLPDPDTPGRTWEAFTFDTFRVADGQLAEHWDGATR
ncbi:MAG: hypothetical protein HY657_18950 [Acidobacteria bacterium]|nr:hypothetical protein [Acidobacteriota bacterium]